MLQHFPRHSTIPSDTVRLRAWNAVINTPLKYGYYAIEALDAQYNYQATSATRQLKEAELEACRMQPGDSFRNWAWTFERLLAPRRARGTEHLYQALDGGMREILISGSLQPGLRMEQK